MKITAVAMTWFAYPLPGRSDSAGSRKEANERIACLVELSAGPDYTGIAVARLDLSAQVVRLANELLMGEDLRGVTGLWERMISVRPNGGRAGQMNDSAAVLDQALWDLKAKANHEPLWKTLGGSRPRVNVHLAGCDLASSDEELSDWYSTMSRDFGFRAGALKVGCDPQADIRRLGLMRQALQPRTRAPTLMIDADECWSSKQAIRNVRAMEKEFDLTWVESPTLRSDFLGMKRVSNSVRAAVCAGEGLDFPSGYLPHLHHHSLNVVQVDTARCGITGALQLADAAFGFELPVAFCESPGNVNAHLAGAMPYCMSMEVSRPASSDGVFTTDVRIENGRAIAGDRSGNGLEVNYEALAKAAVFEHPRAGA